MKTSTYFALMAEFGAGQVELDRVSEKYFGLAPSAAKSRAAMHQLPVPAFRGASQKSPWLISIADLAVHLDERREVARKDWELCQTNSTRGA
ncbi:MAG TPA: pyocin activator PrtN family protein [Steroidobacteraceae bacterium]|jgi:hypothetical protein|nr:pyocin activator PrtN family protein [Steroidobacteraceae bacterium]